MADRLSWKALCAQAKGALAGGQRSEARRLARQAAKHAPRREEPWLLLATMAGPRASQAYLRKALDINPRSRKALAALGEAKGNSPANGVELAWPRSANLALLSLLALTAAFAAFVWLRPPAVDEGLRLMGAAAGQQWDALLASETAGPSESFTATFTPFSTRTALPSNTPTLQATREASPTSTPLPDLEMAIAKFDLELPEDIGADERWIDINLSEQTLSAFEGMDQVNTFIISSGRAGYPTVTGEFSIWVKVRIQTMSGPGYHLENVPWVMYFYGDYGIHGTWWHNNFGTPMSAGCVNMSIPDAQWMYQWASVGTVVKVHY